MKIIAVNSGSDPRLSRCHTTMPQISPAGIQKGDMSGIIEEARLEVMDEKRESMSRVRWKTPRSVWGIDVTEAKLNGGTAFVNLLQDMSSKYKLRSIVTRRDRKEIYEWIIEQKLEIKEKLGDGIEDEEILRKTEDFHAGGNFWRC